MTRTDDKAGDQIGNNRDRRDANGDKQAPRAARGDYDYKPVEGEGLGRGPYSRRLQISDLAIQLRIVGRKAAMRPLGLDYV